MAKKSNTAEFIMKAKLIHKDRYDYSKVRYINSSTKVTIICPIHGEFEQSPNSHLSGSNCNKCVRILNASKNPANQPMSIKVFVDRANKLHNGKYSYVKTVYKTAQDSIIITCPIHGDFEQQAKSHLSGYGCRFCAIQNNPQNQPITNKEFIEKAKLVHNGKYTYSSTMYTKARNKVILTCPIHGEFSIRAQSHLEGVGCPACANYGFNSLMPAYLYYLKITTEDNQILYKIGITNRTVNERFQIADLQKIEIVKQKLYEVGSEALEWETKLKRLYKQYQYKGPNVLSSGNTELFTEDIIAMYYKDNNLG